MSTSKTVKESIASKLDAEIENITHCPFCGAELPEVSDVR